MTVHRLVCVEKRKIGSSLTGSFSLNFRSSSFSGSNPLGSIILYFFPDASEELFVCTEMPDIKIPSRDRTPLLATFSMHVPHLNRIKSKGETRVQHVLDVATSLESYHCSYEPRV